MIVRSFPPKGLVATGTLCLIFLVNLCSGGAAAPITSSNYFPLTPGTKWTYLVNGKDTVKCSVLKEKLKVGGVETSVIYYPQRGIKQDYTSDSQGIRLHQMPVQDLYIEGDTFERGGKIYEKKTCQNGCRNTSCFILVSNGDIVLGGSCRQADLLPEEDHPAS
jgi:hypothetical protein